jgi:hypothetical protein
MRRTTVFFPLNLLNKSLRGTWGIDAFSSSAKSGAGGASKVKYKKGVSVLLKPSKYKKGKKG